jgi:hypothetical protein
LNKYAVRLEPINPAPPVTKKEQLAKSSVWYFVSYKLLILSVSRES